jgi:hypothetical protein
LNWVVNYRPPPRREQLGEEAMTLVNNGPAALWQDITAQAGRQAVGAVKGWPGFHGTFPAADGATRELYFHTESNGTELVRASSMPKEIDPLSELVCDILLLR